MPWVGNSLPAGVEFKLNDDKCDQARMKGIEGALITGIAPCVTVLDPNQGGVGV